MFRSRALRRTLTFAISSTLVLPALVSAATTAGATTTPVTCAGSTFTAGVNDSGAVAGAQALMWGRNLDGELGVGHRGDLIGTPTPLSTANGLGAVRFVWAGFQTGFAVDTSGALWGWGDDSFGQRGVGGAGLSPTPVPGPTNVVSLGPADTHTIAVTADGTVWGWGSPPDLGLPGFFPISPSVIPAPAHVIKVAAGEPYSVALTSDQTLYGTGGNDRGQLGLGSSVTLVQGFVALPVANVVDVAAGDSVGSQFTLAVDASGHVFGFGSNFYGQLGFTASATPQFTPVEVPGIDSVILVAAGDGHSLALKSDGTVWAWGNNQRGELGIGSTTPSSTPTQVQFPAGVRIADVAAGGEHSLALDSDGNVWAWGNNGSGEIGNGFILGPPVLTPVKLSLAGPVGNPCSSTSVPVYRPSVNGFFFGNNGQGLVDPTYEQMARFYPSSAGEMYIPHTSFPSPVGFDFYHLAFVPFYTGYPIIGGAGLCYGMVVSDQILFNNFPDKSAYNDFSSLSTRFSQSWGASPSAGDTTIGDMIYRYHSRQLAAAGAIASYVTWKHTQDAGGNLAVLGDIKKVTDAGKTEWIGFGPVPSLNPFRFATLFGASHAVLAYGVDTALNRVNVYDPNTPGDDNAYIQVDANGGATLVHGDGRASLGGGGGEGQPSEWLLMPLPEAAFSDAGDVPGEDNLHWVLDAGTLAIIHQGHLDTLNGHPLFNMHGGGADDTSLLLPAATGMSSGVTADGPGSQTTQIGGGRAVVLTQTDAAAAGSTHSVTISPDSTAVSLSGASAAQQYTAELAADFLAAGYGRRLTLSGAALGQGSVLALSVDQGYSALTISSTNPAAVRGSLLLEEVSASPGSTTVAPLVPSGGATGTVYVGDWTGLGSSLVFEVVIARDGTVSGLLLQDNAAQRQALLSSLLATASAAAGGITDAGVQSSLQSKLANAAKVAQANPTAAANLLDAARNEVAAQTGKAIDPVLARSLDSTLAEAVGLLRAAAAA